MLNQKKKKKTTQIRIDILQNKAKNGAFIHAIIQRSAYVSVQSVYNDFARKLKGISIAEIKVKTRVSSL